MSRGNLPYSYSSLIAKSKEHLKGDNLKIEGPKQRSCEKRGAYLINRNIHYCTQKTQVVTELNLAGTL